MGLTSHSLSDRVSVNLGLLVFLLEVENYIQVTEVSCKSIGIHIEHVSVSSKTRLKAQEEYLYKKFHGSNKIMIYIHLKTIIIGRKYSCLKKTFHTFSTWESFTEKNDYDLSRVAKPHTRNTCI